MTYLRMTIASWGIDLCTPEGEEIIRQINEDGAEVLMEQQGFIQYRMIRSDRHTTMSVTEWRSEACGKLGAQAFRDWIRENGMDDKVILEDYDGEVVASS